MKNDRIVGFDVDVVQRICEKLGYKIALQSMDFAATIPAVVTGHADGTFGGVTVTPEREKSVLFTTPNYNGGVVLAVRNEAYALSALSPLETVKQSFVRNFITEDRYKMILRGLGVTLAISALSAIFGTILGFFVCLARRSKKKFAALVAKLFVGIIQGTPIVVILMIMYYLIFPPNVNAIWVAVIGFAINFGAYVSEMMRTGIEAVDKGQIEAAQAMGFTRVQTFLKITFPQAARHFLPVYRGEFISLVKMTSIVGYITIEDLTRVSDIIRSRTYEAFFPLITTALIYFLLSYLMGLTLTVLERKLDPVRRKREVKGVVSK